MTAIGELIEQLDPDELRKLADRLRPYMTPDRQSGTAAYTPATLAAEIGRTERSIRAAIARGELAAVKRGRGWVISAEAVAEWSRSPAVVSGWTSRTPRSRPRGPGPARRGLHALSSTLDKPAPG